MAYADQLHELDAGLRTDRPHGWAESRGCVPHPARAIRRIGWSLYIHPRQTRLCRSLARGGGLRTLLASTKPGQIGPTTGGLRLAPANTRSTDHPRLPSVLVVLEVPSSAVIKLVAYEPVVFVLALISPRAVLPAPQAFDHTADSTVRARRDVRRRTSRRRDDGRASHAEGEARHGGQKDKPSHPAPLSSCPARSGARYLMVKDLWGSVDDRR